MNNVIKLSFFQAILRQMEIDLFQQTDGRTSITYLADCFAVLSEQDEKEARRLVAKRLPKDWRGWPVLINTARRQRKAFENAVRLGLMSEDRTNKKYYGLYYHCFSARGKDVFRQAYS